MGLRRSGCPVAFMVWRRRSGDLLGFGFFATVSPPDEIDIIVSRSIMKIEQGKTHRR